MLKGRHGHHYQGVLALVPIVPFVEKTKLVNFDHPSVPDKNCVTLQTMSQE